MQNFRWELILQYISTLILQWLCKKENIFDLIFQKLKISIKWQHTHPHLKQFTQLLAVDRFKKSINTNLKATVDSYRNIDEPKGDSDSVSKNLFLSQYQVNEKVLIKLQYHPHHNEIYQYIET